ncbi:MAG: putative toxin-antitoxin system toxin component, PIN family, partial [Actinomycetota bacterium]
DITQTLKQIARIADIVKPTSHLKILDDDPDNRVLECAEGAEANLIVSNDKHLLRLEKFKDIPIVRATDLLHTILE